MTIRRLVFLSLLFIPILPTAKRWLQNRGSSISKQKLLVFVLIGTFYFLLFTFAGAFISLDIQQEISEKERQIQELERQKEEYQKQLTEKKGATKTLQREISILDTEINKIRLEIRSLDLAIQKTGLEINETVKKIDEALAKMERIRQSLAQFVKLVHRSDQESLVEILLKNRDLSDFFGNLESIRVSQEKAQITIRELKELKERLESTQEELEQEKIERVHLRNIQQIQKQAIDSNKKEKDTILKVTKGEEKKFQDLVKRTEQDIEKIRNQIRFLLEQGISLEDAIRYGQLAAIRVGIRPAFLLAILDVESGLGRNVGTGNWLNDMYNCYLRRGKVSRAETEKSAFFAVIGKLGLNADSVKVSAAPNYGCGGAMGPAQFIPSTWLLYEDEVARLSGHNPPNPWSVEDSFMAAAIYLANAGAASQTQAAEIKAANTYLSGKANCRQSICRYYSNVVLQKAGEIEKDLPKS